MNLGEDVRTGVCLIGAELLLLSPSATSFLGPRTQGSRKPGTMWEGSRESPPRSLVRCCGPNAYSSDAIAQCPLSSAGPCSLLAALLTLLHVLYSHCSFSVPRDNFLKELPKGGSKVRQVIFSQLSKTDFSQETGTVCLSLAPIPLSHPHPPCQRHLREGGHDITSFRRVKVTHTGQPLAIYHCRRGAPTKDGHVLKLTFLSPLGPFQAGSQRSCGTGRISEYLMSAACFLQLP